MATIQQIRADLKEIRYYYSRRKMFDSASVTVIHSAVLDKVEKYNLAVRNAPARLYDLYISLYVQNHTQASLAYIRNCSADYIKQLNKQLCNYLLKRV